MGAKTLMCAYMLQIIAMEADAAMDGGEFSSSHHEKALEKLEPCGLCDGCTDTVELERNGISKESREAARRLSKTTEFQSQMKASKFSFYGPTKR